MITDLIPKENQHQFPDFDPTRTTTLDMQAYRDSLSDAVHSLACDRALGYLRPRAGNVDNDYIPSQST